MLGEIVYFVAVALLRLLEWRATLVVLVAPLVAARVLLAAGNWGQHAFVDLTAPLDPIGNSCTIVNSSYNWRAFNDGYHIGYHQRPHLHWTEMPSDFMASVPQYVRKDAVVFRGTSFVGVWSALMRKRYGWLADRFVDLRRPRRTRQEIVSLLRSRTQPGPCPSLAEENLL